MTCRVVTRRWRFRSRVGCSDSRRGRWQSGSSTTSPTRLRVDQSGCRDRHRRRLAAHRAARRRRGRSSSCRLSWPPARRPPGGRWMPVSTTPGFRAGTSWPLRASLGPAFAYGDGADDDRLPTPGLGSAWRAWRGACASGSRGLGQRARPRGDRRGGVSVAPLGRAAGRKSLGLGPRARHAAVGGGCRFRGPAGVVGRLFFPRRRLGRQPSAGNPLEPARRAKRKGNRPEPSASSTCTC